MRIKLLLSVFHFAKDCEKNKNLPKNRRFKCCNIVKKDLSFSNIKKTSRNNIRDVFDTGYCPVGWGRGI